MITDDKTIAQLATYPTATLYDAATRLGFNVRGAVGRLATITPGSQMAGRALTVKIVPRAQAAVPRRNLYDVMSTASADSIVVVDFGLDRWVLGANIATFAVRCGIRGMLIDGCVRDIADLRKLDISIFCRGAAVEGYNVDGALGSVNVPVECGDIMVNADDYIVADDDGAICIPRDQAQSILYQAEDIAEVDRSHGEGIRAGWSLERIHSNATRFHKMR